MPCCNDSEKDVLEFLENEREKWKSAQNGKMYMKNNGTYFSLNKWILYYSLQFFCTVS